MIAEQLLMALFFCGFFAGVGFTVAFFAFTEGK